MTRKNASKPRVTLSPLNADEKPLCALENDGATFWQHSLRIKGHFSGFFANQAPIVYKQKRQYKTKGPLINILENFTVKHDWAKVYFAIACPKRIYNSGSRTRPRSHIAFTPWAELFYVRGRKLVLGRAKRRMEGEENGFCVF